jgi:L,D-transpeptidase ErfK/SrfK
MVPPTDSRGRRRVAGLAVCGIAWTLASCSLFKPAPPPPVAVVPPPPPAPPPPPVPTATHRFELDGPDTDVVGYVQRTTIGPDDTLPDVARRFDVGYEEIVLANPGVDPWLPGVGREVVVPTEFVLPMAPHEGVVVDVAAMRIFYYPPHKKGERQVVFTHPIGIGRVGWKTPEGTTTIVSRQKDPVWVVPKSVRDEHAEDGEKLPEKVPAGPDNPLGQYMFRLGWPSYLIHGTNKPYGVGMRSSHGCIRLYPEDIAVFFDLIPIGTKVTVVNQPYLFGWRDGTLYLQAYAALEDDKRGAAKPAARPRDQMLNSSQRRRIAPHVKDIDWQRVADLVHKPRGIPVPIMGGGDGLEAIVERARLVQNTVPIGSNWDGKSGLLIDEKTYRELTGRADQRPATAPPAAVAPPAAAAPPVAAAAPAATR